MNTSLGCALFVDHENIFFGLLNEFGDIAHVPAPEAMAKAFRDAAQEYGVVKHAEAIADWEQSSLRGHVKAYIMNGFSIDYNITGKNNADLKISNEIRNVLQNDQGQIGTYIIVTGDGGYQPIVDTLLKVGKQVVIWGVRNCTSGLLQTIASRFETVEKILGMASAEPAELLQEQRRRPTRPVPIDLYSVTPVESLIVSLDELLVNRPGNPASRAELLRVLAEQRVCGETTQEQEFWLNEAVDAGVLKTHSPDHVNPTGFVLNREHPLAQKALGIKTKLFKMLKDTLANNFCPDFKRARDTLVNMIPGLGKSEAHTWLNWYIQHQVIVTEKRPHQQKAGAYFTVLRLNPEHPLVQTSVQETPTTNRLPLLLMFVDDFITEKNVPWVAASTLLKILKGHYLNQDFHGEDAWLEAKDLLNEALKSGVLEKRNERDPMTGFETSQLYLNHEHELVKEVLGTRNVLIQRLHETLSDRRAIARSTFASLVTPDLPQLGSTERVDEWISMLVKQGIFLEREMDVGTATPLQTLQLNYGKPSIVHKIKALTDPGDLPESGLIPETDVVERNELHEAEHNDE